MFLIIFLLIIVVVGFFISKYNVLVHLKALVDEAWSGIDVQLKRRYDLIPNLVETVKGYASHEKSVFENIARLRSAAINSKDIEGKVNAEAGLSQALRTLFAVSENYPGLKSNENFLLLQQDLNTVEHELQLARRYYNGTVRDYNSNIRTFPINIVASILGFRHSPYFEVATSEERENPKVKF